MALNKIIYINRLLALLFFVLVFDSTVGWTIRHIKDKCIEFIFNPGILVSNFQPGAGLNELNEVNFPKRSKIAIEGLREVQAEIYELDASFVRDEKMPPNLLHQRLIEGAWPIKIRAEAPIRVFYIRENVNPSEEVLNNRGGQVGGLDFTDPTLCKKLWLREEVLIAHCGS